MLAVWFLLGAPLCFAAEDMQFVTTLSTPIGVFDRVEVIDTGTVSTAKKATIGVITRAERAQGINTNVELKGNDAYIGQLSVSSGTNLNSETLPVWKTPRIDINKGGSVVGKQVLTDTFTFPSGAGTHTVEATETVKVGGGMSLGSMDLQDLYVGDNKLYFTVPKNANGELAEGALPPVNSGTATWTKFVKNAEGTETENQVLVFGTELPFIECNYRCSSVMSGDGLWKGQAICQVAKTSCPSAATVTAEDLKNCDTSMCSFIEPQKRCGPFTRSCKKWAAPDGTAYAGGDATCYYSVDSDKECSGVSGCGSNDWDLSACQHQEYGYWNWYQPKCSTARCRIQCTQRTILSADSDYECVVGDTCSKSDCVGRDLNDIIGFCHATCVKEEDLLYKR